MPLTEAFAWIEASGLARVVGTTPGVYPLVSALHIMGIALVVGSIVAVDLRLLRVLGPALDGALPSLVRLALAGFAVAATTGALLASVRIGAYAANPAFQAKLAILALAGANALLLRLLCGPHGAPAMVGRPAGRIAATASLSLWASAVLAGRWIAFV